jgi:hypothetical protein
MIDLPDEYFESLKLMITHISFDHLPKEFHQLNIHEPIIYQIYKIHDYYDKFIVKYENFKFMICNGSHVLYPATFVISQKKTNKFDSIILKDNPNDEQCPIANIYYEYPIKIKTDQEYTNEKLLDINLIIERAKKIIGNKWQHELSFGIIIFYYWIQIYYQGKNKELESIYDMFEEQIFKK